MQSFATPYREAVQRLVADTLAGEPTAADVFLMLAQAGDAAERATQQAQRLAPPSPPVACRAGCGWCCTLRVSVTPPEVLRIAAHLRETLAPDALARLRQTLAETEARTRGRSWQEHVALRLPCPLLQEESCSIHAVRPFSCRGYNSVNVTLCRQYSRRPGTTTIPVYMPQQEIADGFRAGISLGVAEAGLEGDMVELVKGLRTALETPQAAERWLAGERVFAVEQDR